MKAQHNRGTATWTVLLVALVASLTLAVGSSGRGAPPRDIKLPHQHHPPGTIVGRETPHLIPRDVTLSVFFRALNAAGVHPKASRSAERAFFDRMQRVSGINLSDFDRKTLALAAAAYVTATKEKTDFRNRRIQALTAGSMWLD